jgi:hypothetical protein
MRRSICIAPLAVSCLLCAYSECQANTRSSLFCFVGFHYAGGSMTRLQAARARIKLAGDEQPSSNLRLDGRLCNDGMRGTSYLTLLFPFLRSRWEQIRWSLVESELRASFCTNLSTRLISWLFSLHKTSSRQAVERGFPPLRFDCVLVCKFGSIRCICKSGQETPGWASRASFVPRLA